MSPSRSRRVRRLLLAATVAPAALLLWTWVAGSLVHFEHGPRTLGVVAAVAWAVGPVFAARWCGPRRALLGALLAAAIWMVAFFALQRPRTDRDWSADQAHAVSLAFESGGRHVVVENVRNSRGGSLEESEQVWETRRLDLATVCCVDFVIEPLPALPGMAHALLGFGFDDGERLVISAEIRRESGETYSPVAGLFRRYELLYVVGDERDLLGLRLDARGHELRVHPLRVSREDAAELLLSMLRRAETLGREPEFYNSLSKNCTTSLVGHLDELRGKPLPFAWQVHLPLHADAVAWELGLIEGAPTLEEARERHRVVGPSPAAGADGLEFSRWLRRHDAGAASP